MIVAFPLPLSRSVIVLAVIVPAVKLTRVPEFPLSVSVDELAVNVAAAPLITRFEADTLKAELDAVANVPAVIVRAFVT